MAGIDPASIGYIETHGTGTELGDPVEIAALRLAYGRLGDRQAAPLDRPRRGEVEHRPPRSRGRSCGRGEGARRACSAARSRRPCIAETSIRISSSTAARSTLCASAAPWPRRSDAAGAELPRRAGVSSFGFGGVNAHVVLEDYPGGANRRAPLPQHRFADTRFWIPGSATEDVTAADETVLHVPQWTEAALPRYRAEGALRRIVLDLRCRSLPQARPLGWSIAIAARATSAHATSLPLAKCSPLSSRSCATRRLRRRLCNSSIRSAAMSRCSPALEPCSTPRRWSARTSSARWSAYRRDRRRPPYRPSSEKRQRIRIIDASVARGVAASFARGRLCLGPRLAPPAWRDGGVYLITGGMGGIGRLIASDIAARAKAPVLVLVGQSPLDDERSAFLEELRQRRRTGELSRS